MKKYIVLPILVAGLVLLGAACSNDLLNANTENENSTENENTNSAVLNTNRDDDNENANTNRNTNDSDDSTTNSVDATDEHGPTVSGTLRVDTPQSGKKLESPFEVEGKSQAETVYVRVKNGAGTALFTESVKVRGGEFHINITYSFTHTTTGSVDVFEKDASGNEVNLINIPVTYRIESEGSSGTSLTENENSNTNEDENENTNDSNEND